MFIRSVKDYAIAGSVVLGFALAGSAANAVVTLSGSVGGVPTGVTYENFDSLSLGAGPQVTGSGISVSFSGTNGGVVNGAQSGKYAAPYISGGNGASFGNPDGVDTTNYLSTGIGSVILDLPGYHQYFGLLWGSVDSYNSVDFYDGANLLASFSGLDVTAAANGDQGASGTYYVNINSDQAFNRVVARSTSYAFEFDNVSFNTGPVSNEVPAPATLALLGLGLAGVGFARRRK